MNRCSEEDTEDKPGYKVADRSNKLEIERALGKSSILTGRILASNTDRK
jgi:hypothetical protein